jgi:hypothetical protein
MGQLVSDASEGLRHRTGNCNPPVDAGKGGG